MSEWWPVAIALPFSALLLLSGVWASRRFAEYEKLPSHFNIRGEADRFAPRVVMVWMLPVLFSAMLLGIAAAVPVIPQDLQNGDPVSGILISGVLLIGAQLLVLWLTVRWARSQR